MRRLLRSNTTLLQCTSRSWGLSQTRWFSHVTPSHRNSLVNCANTSGNVQKRRYSGLPDFENLPENETMYMVEVNEGNMKYQSDQLEEAEMHYTRALKYRPNDPTALLNRSAIVQSLGREDEAMRDLKALVTQMEKIEVPDHFKIQTSTAYLRLGEYTVEKGNFKEALKYLRRANELEPSDSTEALMREVQAYAKPDQIVVNSYKDDEKYFAEITKGMDVEIKKSSVHGRGVFATKDFEEGDIIFIAPSYVTASVEDIRSQHQNEKKKKRDSEEGENILPDVLPNEGVCFHCVRPLPSVVIENWDKLDDYQIKRKYNLTPEKISRTGEEVHKFVGMDIRDATPVTEGKQTFCSHSCKDQAVKNYGQLLKRPNAFDIILNSDEESQDASILMAKVLGRLDHELPEGQPFSLGNDLKRLSSCPNPESVPDSEKPRFEALKALFKQRELSFTTYLQIRTLLNFNCFGVETCQYYFRIGAPEAELAHANQSNMPHPKESKKGEEEKERDREEEEEATEDLPITSQHAPSIDGASLNLVGSFLNHSCEANVLMVEAMSHAGVVPFVASTSIKKGEELFWCYAGKGLDGETRRKMLFLQYKFGCKCVKCTKEFVEKVSLVARANVTDR